MKLNFKTIDILQPRVVQYSNMPTPTELSSRTPIGSRPEYLSEDPSINKVIDSVRDDAFKFIMRNRLQRHLGFYGLGRKQTIALHRVITDTVAQKFLEDRVSRKETEKPGIARRILGKVLPQSDVFERAALTKFSSLNDKLIHSNQSLVYDPNSIAIVAVAQSVQELFTSADLRVNPTTILDSEFLEIWGEKYHRQLH